MSTNWMGYWWVVVPVLALGFYFLPLRLRTWYSYDPRGHTAGFELGLFRGRPGFRRVFNVRRPLTPDPAALPTESTPLPGTGLLNPRTSNFVSHLRLMLRPYDLLPKPLRVGRLDVVVELGTGDAAFTGFAVGSLYASIFSILAPLNTFAVYSEPPRIEITPDYQASRFEGRVDCILLLRLGDIITGVLKLVVSQTAKGVKQRWKNIPSRVS